MPAKKSSKAKAVIVRTQSAGVHFGYVIERRGAEIDLERSRRIWSWQGALSCSELASKGPDVARSKIAVPVSLTLLGVIEVIYCTDAAAAAISGAPTP